MLKVRVWAWSLGLLFMSAFAIFVIRDFFLPASAQAHQILEICLPGFHWLNFWSFTLGLVESFAWGVYLAMVFVPIHNYFYTMHHRPETANPKEEQKAAA